VLKPALEEGAMLVLADAARHNGDTLLPLVVDSQINDARRHRRWAGALVTMALEQEGNAAVLQGWLAKWMPLADRAIDSYSATLTDGASAATRAKAMVQSFHRSLGL
jgi:toluene monooxygenase system protein E